MEPCSAALPRDRRRSPIRRETRDLRARRDRARLAPGRRSGRRRRSPARRAVLVHTSGRPLDALRRPAARPDRAGRPGCGGRRLAQRGAREARDLHRHRDRPRTHERRVDRRDRERRARLGAGRAGPDERAAAVRAGAVLGARRHGPRPRAAGSEANHPDPRSPPGTRRGVRERRAVAPAAVLPRAWRRSGQRRRARVPRGAHRHRRPGRLDARQDRGRGTGRRHLPGPDVHEPDVEPRRRIDPLRVHARARRDGLRRRRRDAAGRGSLPRDDDDGRRGGRAGPVRGVAPDRMARPARVVHERHGAMGGRRGRRTSGARCRERASAPTWTSAPRRSRG